MKEETDGDEKEQQEEEYKKIERRKALK